MDAEQLRIEEDLRGQVDGDVRCDDLFVQMYASDGSIFETPPLGVVRPRSREGVAALVRYAAARGIPIFPRGAGTGLAGDSLGRGLIVDFSRHFRRILNLAEDAVTVQPGVVLAQLNQRLAKFGRQFGPDPAAAQVTTLGSVVALDASGSHWYAYGSARDHVRELEVVLADGQIVRFGRHETPAARPERHADPVGYLASGVTDIVQRHRAALDARRTRSLVDRSGYRLHDVTSGGTVDLARLMVGSEGTLGLVTEAVLATVPLPDHVGSLLLFFPTLDSAARTALELAPRRPRACDMMDRRHLSLARELDPRYELMIPADAEAVLHIELEGPSAEQVRESIRDVEDLALNRLHLAVGSHVALDADDRQVIGQLARQFAPTLHRLRGATRPAPYVEDIAVPPDQLPEFLQQALELLRHRQITASIFAHAAHGQLHIRPLVNLSDSADITNLRGLAEELYEHVWAIGGTISGEHAEGFSRTPYASRQHGPLMAAMREVKSLFDPQGILNPGKKIPLESTAVAPLRRLNYPHIDPTSTDAMAPLPPGATLPPTLGLVDLQLAWRPEQMTEAARQCNGCGACRTQSDDARMCPIFRPSPREESSPRAKANLVRGLLTGALPGGAVLDDEFKQIADLCVHCHMCRLECPASVDVPKLMAEAKAAYVATNGLPLDDWLMTRIDAVCRCASRVPRVANWALGNRVMRWLMEKTLGIAQGRKLPRFARRKFLDTPTQRRLDRPQRGPGDKALVFVDTYANYCDVELAEALVRVLEHNGVSVYVPDRQLQAAMPMISQGILGPARRIAEHNVAILAEAVRYGYTIISTEPSAILALKREYLHLLGEDHDAELVSQNVMDASHFLWRIHQQGRLRLDFRPLPLTVGYHAPCHVKALEVGVPGVNLLRLIPELRVRHVEKGCSGMAGLFGVKRKHYRMSLRAGLPLITELRTAGFQAGATECSTCRMQMEQGAAMPTIHPVKLLALAYGVMPELADALNGPAGPLVVR